MELTVADVRKSVTPIMEKYGVRRARLFGSVASGKATPESNVDILVSFAKPIDGWKYAGMARELEEVLLRKVDLVTENGLSDYIKPHIESTLTPLYEERE